MKMKLSSCSQILGNTFDPARVKIANTSFQRGNSLARPRSVIPSLPFFLWDNFFF
jgi:hypothetical protein